MTTTYSCEVSDVFHFVQRCEWSFATKASSLALNRHQYLSQAELLLFYTCSSPNPRRHSYAFPIILKIILAKHQPFFKGFLTTLLQSIKMSLEPLRLRL